MGRDPHQVRARTKRERAQGRDELLRLRALIEEATRLADLPAFAAEPNPSRRQQTARALDAWLRDWRGTARVLITRRDHQIRLGLAERRSVQEDEEASDESVETAEQVAES